MFRKMTLTLAAVIALAAWASAKPGTWGKEQAGDTAQAQRPGVKFHRWLNGFSAAYKQRDGEKMEELLKQFEEDKAEFPAAPRIETWMGNVKEAYDAQDIHKMDRLLGNAHQMRQRMREHFRQGRMERDDAGFGPQDRPMRRPKGDFRNRKLGPRRQADARPFRQNRGQDFNRPGCMKQAQTPDCDMAFGGRGPRVNARCPMDSGARPDSFRGGRFREQMGRDERGPRMRNLSERPQFDNDMPAGRMGPARRPFDSDRPGYNAAPFERRNFDRQKEGPRMQRRQHRPFNDNSAENFWD